MLISRRICSFHNCETAYDKEKDKEFCPKCKEEGAYNLLKTAIFSEDKDEKRRKIN